MRKVSNEEMRAQLDRYKDRKNGVFYSVGFMEGIDWLLDEQAKPEPHKAEVVKCGMIHTETSGSIPCNVSVEESRSYIEKLANMRAPQFCMHPSYEIQPLTNVLICSVCGEPKSML